MGTTASAWKLGATIDSNLALDLVRVTEGAAMAAARLMGRNLKEDADQAAVNAMRERLAYIDMDGVVVIGEGEKDRAPMLFIRERIGKGKGPQVDVAVDPIDGTRLVAEGLSGGIATVGLAERGTLHTTRCAYMEKLIVGPLAAKVIDITDSVAGNLRRIANAEERAVQDLTVVVLKRERHEKLLGEIRAAGARVKLITDGDVAAGLMAAMEERTGIDVLMGIGGAPEGVLTACAVKALGGGMQARLAPLDETDRAHLNAEGKDPSTVLELDDLCAGENVFFAATGITDGELLEGVRFEGSTARTQSVVMRSWTGTIRYIDAVHNFPMLRRHSQQSNGS